MNSILEKYQLPLCVAGAIGGAAVFGAVILSGMASSAKAMRTKESQCTEAFRNAVSHNEIAPPQGQKDIITYDDYGGRCSWTFSRDDKHKKDITTAVFYLQLAVSAPK